MRTMRIFGEVTNNNDPEQEGRVKVKSDQLEAQEFPAWLEPSFSMAGAEWGIFFVPEVGDLVEIEIDDRPQAGGLYARSVYTPTNKIPAELLANYPNRMGIVTKGGHKIFLDRKAGAELFSFEDKAGNKVLVDSANKKIRITDANGNDILLDSAGVKITDKSVNKIEMTSSGIKLTDKNNNTVEMISGKVAINGANLEVLT
jgi:uncharacterized protein involved in type VI secretion and phage assembly